MAGSYSRYTAPSIDKLGGLRMVMYMIPELPEHFFLMVAAFIFGPGVFLIALSAVLGLVVSRSRGRGGDVFFAGLGITALGYVVGILGFFFLLWATASLDDGSGVVSFWYGLIILVCAAFIVRKAFTCWKSSGAGTSEVTE